MSPAAQRIAIAEACGYWKPVYQPFKEPQWFSRSGLSTLLSQLPDYLTDLNAMHEAETRSGMIIGPAEWDEYCLQLRIKIGRDIEAKGGPGSVAGLICLESAVSATAAQRAEAFLRTIGRWEDQP